MQTSINVSGVIMRITFVITFAYEPVEQLDWCLSNLRSVYDDANVILISDGNNNPEYPMLARKYNTTFILGEKLKVLSCGALWWKRFITEALKTDGDIIFKIDPDTKIWRRFNYMPTSDFFGMLKDQGASEHVQGGCQGFNRKFAEQIIDSKITEEEEYKSQNYWGCRINAPVISDYFRAGLAAPDYFSTDWSMMHIAKKLAAKIENHPEILSIWVSFDFLRKSSPDWTMRQFAVFSNIPKNSETWDIFVEGNNPELKYAVTHPHKVSILQ